ncbi:MAG: hypothetical protein ABI670_07470 [Chloroflexota bacterium]
MAKGLRLLTEDALLVCNHELGHVKNRPTQDLVTIEQRRVLVENNPEGCNINGCPNLGAAIMPCMHTLKVDTGYSEFIRIDGKKACLDTVTGFTDGTPPGVVKYKVRTPGQEFVWEAGE